MIELIKRNINFIAWDNFLNPYVYRDISIGLIEILVFVSISLIVSYIYISKKFKYNSLVEEFVFRTTLGISTIGFSIAILGLLQFINIFSFISLLAIFIIFSYIRNKMVFNDLFLLLKQIFIKYKWLWILFIINTLPSLLPVYRYDEMSYHLPYVMKWFEQGKIFVDPTMRYPLYTFNFHCVELIGFFLNSTNFNHLLSWLTGVLTTFAIIAFLKRFNIKKFIIYISALAFFFTPLVQRYLNLAYLDVPIMFFMLMALYSIILTKKNIDNKRLVVSTSIIVAFFVGIKMTGALFVPLIFILIIFKQKLKKTILFLIIFSIFGSIWYVRNIVINNDPIPPVLNIKFNKPDIYWSKKDFQLQMNDLKIDRGDSNLLFDFPLELISSNINSYLRDFPIMGYALLYPFSLILLLYLKNEKYILDITIFTTYSIAVWFITAYLIRYAHFIPLIIISVALLINKIDKKILVNKYVKYVFYLVVTLLFFTSKPLFISFYKNNYSIKIPYSKQEINKFIGYGDSSLFNFIDNMNNKGIKKNSIIYTYELNQYKYYFQKQGYYIVGDNFRKCSFNNFDDNVKKNKLKKFLEKCKVNYLLIVTSKFNDIEKFDLVIKYKTDKYILFEL